MIVIELTILSSNVRRLSMPVKINREFYVGPASHPVAEMITIKIFLLLT